MVTLSLWGDQARESWVLTGYERRKGGPGGPGGVNPDPSYAPASPRVSGAAGAGPTKNVRARGLGGKAFTRVIEKIGELSPLLNVT